MYQITVTATGYYSQGGEMYEVTLDLACEQALLFGRVKRVSRERASERRSRDGQSPLHAHSREVCCTCPNRRACLQATLDLEQKPAMIISCTVHFGRIMQYQPGPIKLSFLP